MATQAAAPTAPVLEAQTVQTGYIILERDALTVGNLLMGTTPPATAMLITSPEWLRQLTVPQITEELGSKDLTALRENLFGSLLRVKADEVARWGLATGMKVQWEKGPNGPVILSVEGERDHEKIRRIPLLTGVKATEVQPPVRPLPIERNGNPNVRARTLFAPQGFGSLGLYLGPEGSGKSYALREDAEATIALMPDYPNLTYIGCYIGERATHGTMFRRVIHNAMKKHLPPEEYYRVEYYTSPDQGSLETNEKTDSETAHYYLAWFVVSRARWLARFGRDVVLDLESLTRIMLSYDHATGIPKSVGKGDDPMVAPGIHVSALRATADLYSIAGDFPELGSSLTIRATCFGNYRDGRQPLQAGFENIALSMETLLYVFEDNPQLEKPSLNVTRSRTRDHELFMDKRPKTWSEMKGVAEMRWTVLVPLSKENKRLYLTTPPEDELFELIADYDPADTPQLIMTQGPVAVRDHLSMVRQSEQRRISGVLEKRDQDSDKKGKKQGSRQLAIDRATAEIAHARHLGYSRLAPFPPD